MTTQRWRSTQLRLLTSLVQNKIYNALPLTQTKNINHQIIEYRDISPPFFFSKKNFHLSEMCYWLVKQIIQDECQFISISAVYMNQYH